jgi:hypothetical protein
LGAAVLFSPFCFPTNWCTSAPLEGSWWCHSKSSSFSSADDGSWSVVSSSSSSESMSVYALQHHLAHMSHRLTDACFEGPAILIADHWSTEHFLGWKQREVGRGTECATEHYNILFSSNIILSSLFLPCS